MSRGASPIRVRRAQGHSFLSQAGAATHRRKLWRLLAITALAVGLGLSYVWQHIQTNLIGYHVREIELQNHALHEEIAKLENQVAQLTAPARLDAIARNDLGLVRRESWDIVSLPAPTPATPPAPAPAPDFWEVQARRWARVGERVERAIGPARAVAAPLLGPQAQETDGE